MKKSDIELINHELKRRVDVIKHIVFEDEKLISAQEKIVVIKQLFEQEFYSEE